MQRAREKFAPHAFMRFQTLDLEKTPAAQGLADGAFDVIIAANVVHATRDLRLTLQRLRSLLAPGGELLMLEVAGLERWIDISFGLTDGWWGFDDTALRADYPLLSRPAWLELLGSLLDAGGGHRRAGCTLARGVAGGAAPVPRSVGAAARPVAADRRRQRRSPAR